MGLRGAEWPVFGWADDMRPALAKARREGRTVALATIVALDGSAPRLPGTRMVFDGAQASGHFSGGCVEADIANHAAEVVRGGEPALLAYGRNSPWLDIRLACGSGIEIMVERIAPDDHGIERLLELAARRIPALSVSDGQSRAVAPHDGTPRLAFSRDPLRLTQSHEPPWRLVVVGGDPTALAIAQLATQTGFETILVRHDGPASPPPLDLADYRRGDAMLELEAIALDRWTALAIASHEPELEHGLLAAALRGEAAYVGVQGAGSRVPQRRARLRQSGLSGSAIARLRAPMGLAHCGKAPWEVAVSVMADILRTREATRGAVVSSEAPAAVEPRP